MYSSGGTLLPQPPKTPMFTDRTTRYKMFSILFSLGLLCVYAHLASWRERLAAFPHGKGGMDTGEGGVTLYGQCQR